MTDEPTDQEPGSLSGDVVPSGPGDWLTLDEAGKRLGIDRKAVYRRIRRGKMVGKKAPQATHLLVWFPFAEEQVPTEEPRSLAVPDQSEQFALALEASIGRALAPLHETIDKQQTRIEDLIRENERFRLTEEQRSQEREQEHQERPWWKWW